MATATATDTNSAVQTTRGLIDDSTELNGKIFDAWAAGAEAGLKATFELQNAGLAAGLSLIEAAASTERTVLKQWDSATRQAQQAALDAFHAQIRAATRLSKPSRYN